MVKKLLSLMLLTIYFASAAYANEYIPNQHYKDPVQEFNYVKQVVHTTNPPWAEYKLGKYYEEGYGTKPDPIQAYVWYKLGKLNKSEHAAHAFEQLKSHLSKEQVSQGEALYQKTRDQISMAAINQIRNFNLQSNE